DELLPSAAQVAVQPLPLAAAAEHGIRLDILRLDMSDEIVSGNKWFKLIRNLQTAVAQRHTSVLTFGGAWSNHLVATAAAAARVGLAGIGLVRGVHAESRPT